MVLHQLKMNTESNEQPLDSTADSEDTSGSPWIHHFRPAAKWIRSKSSRPQGTAASLDEICSTNIKNSLLYVVINSNGIQGSNSNGISAEIAARFIVPNFLLLVEFSWYGVDIHLLKWIYRCSWGRRRQWRKYGEANVQTERTRIKLQSYW